MALYGYAHVAAEGGFELAPLPHLRAWLERVRALPGAVHDLAPYPPNDRAGAGRSVYDPAG